MGSVSSQAISSSDPHEDELLTYIRAICADCLGVSEVGESQDMITLGLESMRMLLITAKLQKSLSIDRLDARKFWKAVFAEPTPKNIVSYLAGQHGISAAPSSIR